MKLEGEEARKPDASRSSLDSVPQHKWPGWIVH